MSSLIKILILENEVEANLLDEILKDKNIPHIIRSYHDLAYDGIFQTQKGWGHVEALDKYKEEILEIYNDIKQS
ncbi:MAG: hypothetical protein FH751_16985 [Firmicutes bacterium]|nr:hypothetical protein [Bacillota bacterium]